MNKNLIITSCLVVTMALSAITVGNAESPTDIFMATLRGVNSFSLATSQVSSILTKGGVGIAHDSKAKKIYVSDTFGILRANLDGSEVETVLEATESSAFNNDRDIDPFPRGLSIDSSTGNLYVQTAFGSVLVCNTTTSKLDCVQIAQLGVPGETYSEGYPALDPQSGTMYLTSFDLSGRIWRAGMDGSNLRVIHISRDTTPVAVALDVISSRLYWTDYFGDRIQSSDLDGQNVQTLVQLPAKSEPWGIVKLGDRIYWGNYGAFSLQSCDSAGQDVRTDFNGTTSIHHLAVV